MRIEVDGIGLEVDVQGDGTPVLLLHGWPDSHDLWRHQIAALTGAGYRTIAPDLRGFGASDRPTQVEAYDLLSLVGDVFGILDHLGVARSPRGRSRLGRSAGVGDRHVRSPTVSTTSSCCRSAIRLVRGAGFAQREKSWYMLLFQFQGIAEQWLSADDWANFRACFAHPETDAVVAELARDRARSRPA